MLTLRAALQQRRSTPVWALLTALCGAASLSYLFGIGVAVAVVFLWRGAHPTGLGTGQRRWSRPALRAALQPLWLSALAAVWLLVLGALHATVGSPAYGYAYLSGTTTTPTTAQVVLGILRHLPTAFGVLRSHGWNLWANTSPDGLVGVLSPAFFLVAPPLLANNLLHTQAFSNPNFQNFVAYGSVALGSVAVVVTLLRRRRAWVLGGALAAAMVLNAAGWFHAWFASTYTTWLRMSSGAAATVERVASEAGAGDEVVASQGFVGALAGRPLTYALLGTNVIPIRSRTVWFLFSYTEGIETASAAQTIESIDTVSRLPGVELLDANVNGIYAFRWNPPRGTSSLVLGAIGAQRLPGPAVVALTSPAAVARAAGHDPNGSELVAGDDFWVPAGSYAATVRLQARGPVVVEVWDEPTRRELGAAVVSPLHAQDVRIPFGVQVPPVYPPGVAVGSGLFRYLVNGPQPSRLVEVSVIVQNAARASASWTAVSPVFAAP
jgi:hypothetical protein